ncbi:zinc-dependent metalloprotease [Chenggangzhangella methanolivorans]|uniref:Zinc-dependent metalloprotease n=1 Tax=Chenggangzhangella methanolivorans TaxID=1437009 RepID=A0A9E6UJ32_9HYPH|nr:zinc-dependent metalloprotease [Chenggangzhangella methanolivorans]QZO01518.1 zinc-dependent metalloprotease [Chenggangzhangella methanolivorans]
MDLLAPIAPHQAIADARPVPGATREALVSLDPNALSSGKPVRIRLFPGAEATFAPSGTEPAVGGGTVWTGTSGADAATLVLADGGVVGVVRLGTKTFRIEQVKGAAHKVAEISGAKLPPEGPLTPAPGGVGAKPAKKSGIEPQAKGDVKITLLMAYTDRAAAASSNIVSDINLAVSLANEAYKAGGVGIKLKLVGTTRVSGYDELTGGFAQVLYDVTNDTAPFQPVNQLRNQLKADLVAVIQEGTQYCGIAWYIDEPSASTAGYGYSTTARGCITGYTVTHELGHNMGLRHDRYVSEPAPDTEYNFGYSNLAKQKRSIMAYSNECTDAGLYCERVNSFSDPDKKVAGKKFGIKQGKPGAADNARRLNETRKGIAAYR